MNITIKPSDLYYLYRHKKETRDLPKFTGKPDKTYFDRDNLYEVLTMFEVIMNDLNCQDGDVLHRLEEMMHFELPKSIETREEIYDCLYHSMREILIDLGRLKAG